MLLGFFGGTHIPVVDILCWSSFIFLNAIPFPAYQVLEFPPEDLAVQNVHFVLLNPILDYWGRWNMLDVFRDGIYIIGSQQGDQEDRVGVAKG